MNAGYYDHHDRNYENPLYHTLVTSYRVCKDMPRIIVGDLPKGVSNVRYSVSLTSLSSLTCENTEILKIIRT